MKSFIYTLLCVSLVLSACEKALDRPPLDQISTDDYWKTSGDLGKYILQFYPMLPRHEDVGQATEEVESDNLIVAVPNLILNGGRTVTTVGWTDDWEKIRKVNIFFDNYKKVSDPIASYRHFLGEAHFFKAWFYFDLMRQYGDLPWYSSEIKVGSPELMKARDPRTLVADSILLNIDRAIEYLNPRSTAGNARLNKEAALAFKTRVALFEGTWQKYHRGTPYGTAGADPLKYFRAAVDAGTELMNGTTYVKGLYSTGKPQTDYYNLFGMDNMSAVNEVLLYRAANSSQGLGNNVQNITTNGLSVTWELVSSYLAKNGQPYDYLTTANTFKGNDFLIKVAADADPRFSSTVWIPGDLRVAKNNALFDKPNLNQAGAFLNATGFQVKKFSNPFSPAAGGNQVGGLSETGYIIFRYGEVLLNYAEAKYELDGTVATAQLNLLRSRVGMPAFAVNPQSADLNRIDYGYTITDELYEIRRERRVEMALEGRRTDDYRRWAAHKLFAGKRLLGYPFKQTEFPTFRPALTTVGGLIDFFRTSLPNGYAFRPGKDYLDDIPQVERTLNPNLSQNPGW
jgi:hypothetical protein